MEYDLPQPIIEVIEEMEGEFHAKPYKDINGVLTIGYGHTNATGTFKFNKNTVITKEQGLEILAQDLGAARGHAEQMLKNRNLTATEEQLDYMMLVYFNRPWALAATIDVIAEGNIDLVRKAQLDAYEQYRGEEAPQWYINRIDKEVKFANEFDSKTDLSGNRIPEGPVTIFDASGNPVDVHPMLVDDLLSLKPAKYFPEPGQVVEPDISKINILDGFYSKFKSQVPEEAGSYEAAQIKTDIRRQEANLQ